MAQHIEMNCFRDALRLLLDCTQDEFEDMLKQCGSTTSERTRRIYSVFSNGSDVIVYRMQNGDRYKLTIEYERR